MAGGPSNRTDWQWKGEVVTEDDQHIRRTLAQYSQWCDDGRFDEWEQLFTDDARLVFADQTTVGRPAIREYMERVQAPAARGKHLIANSLVDVDGDTASAVTDYLFIRASKDGLAMVASGRYYDELVREGSQWRFRRRLITLLAPPDPGSDG